MAKKPKSALDLIPVRVKTEVVPVSLLAELAPEERIAKLFQAKALTIELHMPDDKILDVLRDEHRELPEAEAFVIESDDEYELAKERAFALKDEADSLETTRKEGTQPLLGMKYSWDSLFSPVVTDKLQAAVKYIEKMRTYESNKRLEAEEKKLEAEEQLKAQQTEAIREADEIAARAKRTKSVATRRALEQEAEGIRRSAELMPTEVATSQIAEPQMGSGSKAQPWIGEIAEEKDALRWLLEPGHEEWISALIDWRPSGLNMLAKQIKNTRKIDGFKFYQKSSYRRPPKSRG